MNILIIEDEYSLADAISETLKNEKFNVCIKTNGEEGEYEIIIVNTSEEVTLNLNNVTITNSSGPAINIEKAKKITIVLSGTNKITSTTTEDLDGAIYSKADLVFEGTGSIEVKSNYDGIVSKDTLVITIFIYQSMSGDAEVGTSSFTSKNSKIINNKGDMILTINAEKSVYHM